MSDDHDYEMEADDEQCRDIFGENDEEPEGSVAPSCSRPFSGERRFHVKHGEVEVLRTWGDRACKVRVIATGKREILFDENLHRENEENAATRSDEQP